MGIGASVFLIAVGAVLTFAVNATINGFDINTVGIILMAVGGLGLLLTLFIWAPRRTTTTRGDYVEERVVREHPVERDTVRRY